MTVLVSGANGFLGTAFLRQLGRPVMALLRGSDHQQRARTLTRRTGVPVTAVPGDVRAELWGLRDDLGQVRGRVSAIVNLAGVVNWAAPWSLLSAVNVEGAHNAASLAASLDVPLLHVSSLYAAYDFADEVPQTLLPEQADLTKYERSKIQGEWAVADVCGEHGVPAWIARVGALSGDLDQSPRFRDGSLHVPFTRLVATGSWRVFPYAAKARLDIGPRDVVAAGLVKLLDARPSGVQVRHVCLGAKAPLIESIVREAAASQRGQDVVPGPIRVPARWLQRASLLADRGGQGPRSAALIGLRYFASGSVFETSGLDRDISLQSLVRTLGLPHRTEPPPISSYYGEWPA
jgi:nucleoside-diphosphate-sugar epimerase